MFFDNTPYLLRIIVNVGCRDVQQFYATIFGILVTHTVGCFVNMVFCAINLNASLAVSVVDPMLATTYLTMHAVLDHKPATP